ncbi:amino acid ABC transporter permease [Reinekea thalattae]|uniref:Amino acid ABC transporter permease n=1 Tax=Reinekea thalattae TaxID=2593301 RepID=A0A5C8ZAI2_9GAMM|nr:amino acid ABC transporter permease [Reinekea thalattae]TXR54198.1 amino acid ABC transporter permease [Reinekea thalattae]
MNDSSVTKSSTPAKPPFWRDPDKRALAFQGVFLLLVLFVIFTLIRNTMVNLEARGISSGFGFLGTAAGFRIAETMIPFDTSSTYFDVFLVGLLNTLKVSIIGVFFATIIGFVVGVARLSNNWIVSRLAAIYVDTLRNIPLLLQLFFWYFAVLRPLKKPEEADSLFGMIFLSNRGLFFPAPVYEQGFGLIVLAVVLAIVGSIVLKIWAKKRMEATGQRFPVFFTSLGLIVLLPLLAAVATGFPISWDIPELAGTRIKNFVGGQVLTPEFSALVFALAIYTSSFIAEIVRSGIMSVSKGQSEAAFSLGLKPSWTTRLVIIPQALRVIIPPLTSQYLNLTKNSSLAAAIGYPELVSVFAGTALNNTGQAVEIMGITLMVYLFLSLTISSLMNWYNASKALVER